MASLRSWCLARGFELVRRQPVSDPQQPLGNRRQPVSEQIFMYQFINFA
jgi:hypothetical protein